MTKAANERDRSFNDTFYSRVGGFMQARKSKLRRHAQFTSLKCWQCEREFKTRHGRVTHQGITGHIQEHAHD